MLAINRRETPEGDAAEEDPAAEDPAEGDAAEEAAPEEATAEKATAEGDAVAGAPLPVVVVAWSKSASMRRSAGLRRRPVRR